MDAAVAGWVVGGLIGLVVLIVIIYFWSTYNSLITLGLRVEEAWSDITVQLKRRADLIPQLVDTVRGYASHERGVFTQVTEARTAMINARSPEEVAKADNIFQEAMKSIFAVAEAYPQLQASHNFLELQAQLADTENKIQGARRFYNGGVREYNTKLDIFPNSLWARGPKFQSRDFFDLPEQAASIAEPPKIRF